MCNVLKKIQKAFNKLEKRVFVSEADFQHAFAMKLEKQFPGKVRLEYPIKKPKDIMTTKGDCIYADILIKDKEKNYIIELKYKTRSIKDVPETDEDTELACKLLKDQSAQDYGMYAFWADISRTEKLVDKEQFGGGVCIFLTNDMSYCNKHENTTFRQFSISGGEHKRGKRKWSKTDRCKDGYITKLERTLPVIPINNDYTFRWQDFRKVSESKGGEFKYLYVEILPKTES